MMLFWRLESSVIRQVYHTRRLRASFLRVGVSHMGVRVIGRLYGDALEEYREIAARYEALRVNPGVFSQAESIKIVRDYYAVLGRIIHDFGVDPASQWS